MSSDNQNDEIDNKIKDLQWQGILGAHLSVDQYFLFRKKFGEERNPSDPSKKMMHI